jgi:hypothetical protein
MPEPCADLLDVPTLGNESAPVRVPEAVKGRRVQDDLAVNFNGPKASTLYGLRQDATADVSVIVTGFHGT